MVLGSTEAASQYSKVKGRLSLKKERSPSGSEASAAAMGDVESKPVAAPPLCQGKENVEVEAVARDGAGAPPSPLKGNPQAKLSKKERELLSLTFTSPGAAWAGHEGSSGGTGKRPRRSKALDDEDAQLAEALRLSEEDARRSQEAKEHGDQQKEAAGSNPPSARKSRSTASGGEVDALRSADRAGGAVRGGGRKAGRKSSRSAFLESDDEDGVVGEASQQGSVGSQGWSQRSGSSRIVSKKARRHVVDNEGYDDAFQAKPEGKAKFSSTNKPKQISGSDDAKEDAEASATSSASSSKGTTRDGPNQMEVSDSEDDKDLAPARKLPASGGNKKTPRADAGKTAVQRKGRKALMMIDDSDEEADGAKEDAEQEGKGGAGGSGDDEDSSEDESEGVQSPSESEACESDDDDDFDESSDDGLSKKKKGKGAAKKDSQPNFRRQNARGTAAKSTPSTRATPRSTAVSKLPSHPTGKSLQQQAIAQKKASASAEMAGAPIGVEEGQQELQQTSPPPPLQQQQQQQQKEHGQAAGPPGVAASLLCSSEKKAIEGGGGGAVPPKVLQKPRVMQQGGGGGGAATSLAGSVASAPPRTGLSKFRSSGISGGPSSLPGNGARRVGLSRPKTSLHKVAPVVHR